MFGVQFYPTPRKIADIMVAPYRDKIKAGAFVLDPSAGKGDLLEAASYYRSGYRDALDTSRLLAVEIDQNLQAILRQKKFRVIGEDWMQYSSHYHFDIILMNPPFANGDEHLLKAWDVLRGGEICCLLNAETIRNPYTFDRQRLAEIIAQNGTVEYLGDAFAQAERKTGVEVAMVRLTKKAPDRFGFDGINTRQGEERTFEAAMDHMPARRDLVGSLVASYDAVHGALEDYIKADLRLRSLTNDFWTGFYKSEAEKNMLERLHKDADGPGYYNAYMDVLKRAAWHQVFQRTNMKAIMTDRVRKDWATFQGEQGAAEFSHANIMAFFDLLISNRQTILHQCIVDVFDRMTSYDKKNKVHHEGWKTNSAYKVNKKVILPYFISNHSGSWGNSLSVNHNKWDQMDDMDRAMCLVTGKSFDNVRRFRSALEDCVRGDKYNAGKGESEFFTFQFFLKGTVHLKFKDDYVWAEFNRMAAHGKGWIGDGE